VAKLGSIEGTLELENGQSTTITPGSGTLTVSNTGDFDVERESTVKISGNLTNSGDFYTNQGNQVVGPNNVTVTGAFTNSAGALTSVGNFSDTSDVLNVGTLTNNGELIVGVGATLNLTSQPNGVTDVVQGSQYYIAGGFTAGSASAVAKLGSIEGTLELENGQSTTITPGSGTLTVSNTGDFDVERESTVKISGNLTNSGDFYTNEGNQVIGPNNVTITGAFTNNAGAFTSVGNFSDTSDVLNVGTLSNNGELVVGVGATLNLTNQPNGVTDVVQGSLYYIAGGFTAGSASAVSKLGSIEGLLELENGQSTTITPGSGTLTVSNTGDFDVERGSTVKISGNLTNSGNFYTNQQNQVIAANTVTVTGALTNNAGAVTYVGDFSDTSDVLNVGTLSNNGELLVGVGATLNLTNQPNGVTDVVQGSLYYIAGGFKAGSASAVAKLGSIEGLLELENGQSTTIAPGSGTLTVSNTGDFDVERESTVKISGNLTNSGSFYTNQGNQVVGPNNVTVTGTLTNNTGATTSVGNFGDTADVLNAGLLTNSGTLTIGTGATLDLTSSGADSNTSTISLNSSTLKFSGASTTLSGAGTISLSNSATNLITGVGSGITLTSANTIEGAGTISNLGLVNTGTILANQSTPLIILPNSSGLNNKGILNVSTGDTLLIGTSAGGALVNFAGNTLTGGTYLVSGTLQFGASGTSIVTNDANITLTGASSQIIDFGGHNVLANLATNDAGATFTLGSMRNFTTAANFTNDGTLVVGSGDKFEVNGNLTNFSGTTLTGGTYNITGTLQFDSANIVTNDANITLSSSHSQIVSNTNANALANFAVNDAGASFALGSGRSFTTAGNFTNNGSLTVGSGDTFDVNGNLTNFSGTTLGGGTYNVTGTLEFDNANIVTNAANLILNGTTAKIENQTAVNALANFANNTGSFTLSGNAALSTSGGNFTNSGTFIVNTGSTFTVGGSGFNFTQSGGTTTVNGTLQGASSGTLALNAGMLFGGGTLGYAVVDDSTITPGASASKTGILSVSNTYAQNSTGALDISISGTTVGTQYDELKVTDGATLGGTLNISLLNHFVPTIGSTFDILNAGSLSGTFATVNGLSINGSEHFSISYNGTEAILTVVSGAATDVTASFGNTMHRVHQGYGLAPYHPALQNAVAAPVVAPVRAPSLQSGRGFHAADLPSVDPVSPITVAGPGPAFGPQRGYGQNSLIPFPNPAMADHSRLEIGVDVKALLKASPKRILRSFNPDTPDPVSIGYFLLSPAH
jgi:ribosomal protein L24E